MEKLSLIIIIQLNYTFFIVFKIKLYYYFKVIDFPFNMFHHYQK